jgi:hypothetical protein
MIYCLSESQNSYVTPQEHSSQSGFNYLPKQTDPQSVTFKGILNNSNQQTIAKGGSDSPTNSQFSFLSSKLQEKIAREKKKVQKCMDKCTYERFWKKQKNWWNQTQETKLQHIQIKSVVSLYMKGSGILKVYHNFVYLFFNSFLAKSQG